MGEIVAEHLRQKLAQGGFVVMKKAPAPATSMKGWGSGEPPV